MSYYISINFLSWILISWHHPSWLLISAMVHRVLLQITITWIYHIGPKISPHGYVYSAALQDNFSCYTFSDYNTYQLYTYTQQTYVYYYLTHTYDFDYKLPYFHLMFNTILCLVSFILMARPHHSHITQQMEETSLSEELIHRRVISHSDTAIFTGIREWRFCLDGKLYALGIMIWQDAEKDARSIWPHLRRNDHWYFKLGP